MEVDDQDVSDNFVLQIELLEQENTKLKTINEVMKADKSFLEHELGRIIKI